MSPNKYSPADLLGRIIAAIRVNVVYRDKGGSWVKRRRYGMGSIITLGNVFLRLSRSRILMFPSVSAWGKHEVSMMCTLHGGDAARRDRPRQIVTRELPGESLRSLFQRRNITPNALFAAGREMARMHALQDPSTQEPLSHGDPHTGNLLYDGLTNRAHMIDLETYHAPNLSWAERQADDLLVLLLDILGRCTDETWVDFLGAVIDGYRIEAPERSRLVFDALELRLDVPRGWGALLERALWATRTNYVSTLTLDARLSVLRNSLARVSRDKRGC